MPRVNLGRDRYADSVAATSKIIQKAMIDKDMKFKKEAAQVIGMDADTFAKKLRTGTWTHKELFTIAAVFKISNDDLLLMLGRRA
jgi:hypothetical protein